MAKRIEVKKKVLEEMIKKLPDFELNYKNVVFHIHTHAELCGKEEIVYREEDVLLLVRVFYEKGYLDGSLKGQDEGILI